MCVRSDSEKVIINDSINTVMSNENNIKVGTNTANLLMALRAIESARNYYFLAMEETRGTAEESEPMTPEENANFDRVRDMVQKEIDDNVLMWANTTDEGGEL